MEDRRIAIKFCVKNDFQYVKEWFIKMLLFKPEKMKMKYYKRGKFISYNEKIFIEEMSKEIINSDYSIFVKDNRNSITCFLNYDSREITTLTATLDYEIFRENEEQIYYLINEVMSKVGVVGRIVSSEDYFWQNNIDVSIYADRNKSIKDIPLVNHPIFKGQQAVDVKKLPGYEEQVGNVWVGAAWKMWFNDFYYQYIPKESIENFSDCYSNEKLSDTCRCITLYENLWDYNNPENRQRQWKFKEAINFVENVNKLKSNKEVTNSDPHVEILNGQFEHGGVRLFKFYFDKEGKDTTKSRASIVIIEEYDENKNLVWKSQDALKTE